MGLKMIAISSFISLQRLDAFFTTAATRQGLQLTLEPPFKSHGNKDSVTCWQNLITECLILKNALSSAWSGGKILRQFNLVYGTKQIFLWRNGSPYRRSLKLNRR